MKTPKTPLPKLPDKKRENLRLRPSSPGKHIAYLKYAIFAVGDSMDGLVMLDGFDDRDGSGLDDKFQIDFMPGRNSAEAGSEDNHSKYRISAS